MVKEPVHTFALTGEGLVMVWSLVGAVWLLIGFQHIVDEDVYKDASLEENMVISLEHIISFPDTGEFQIEDQFVVKKGGAAR